MTNTATHASRQATSVGSRRRFARVIGRIAAVLVIIVHVVQELWGEKHWATAIITYAPPIIYLAIPALAGAVAVLSLDLRSLWWSIVTAGLCLLGVARPSYPLYRPHAPPNKTFRIVTWNIHDRLEGISRIRAILDQLDPDIVCLQEANARQFRECWPGANAVHAHSSLIMTSGRITKWREVTGEGEGPRERRLLGATIELDGATLSVLNAHLYSLQPAAVLKQPSSRRARAVAQIAVQMRQRQMDEIIRWIENQSGPTVVAGDFNTPPRGRLYKRLCRSATDSFATVGKGFGWTFPSYHPLLRIDYVWLGPGVKPVRCWRIRAGPSDHCPVVADIVLP